MNTPQDPESAGTVQTTNVPAVDLPRFEVQQRCPLQGWNTWVIYDEKRHAVQECARRISEAALRDKNNWRVSPVMNDPSAGTALESATSNHH